MVAIPGYEHVSSMLDRVKRTQRPGYWTARCPAHPDRTPSLSLWIGRDGRLLLRCWSCGRGSLDPVRALGLPMRALFPDYRDGGHFRPRRRPMRKIVATYDYVAADGEVLYQKVRYEPKDFAVRRPDPHGKGWLYGLADDTPRVLYRLPELLATPEREWVWITEGEKDADALALLDLASTTNHEGSECWPDTHSRALVGRRCVLVPDNDEAGRRKAALVAGSLLWHGVAALKLLRLTGLPEKGDISDWLADFPRGVPATARRRALLDLLRQAPTWACLAQPKGDYTDGQGRSGGRQAEGAQPVRRDAANRPHAPQTAGAAT